MIHKGKLNVARMFLAGESHVMPRLRSCPNRDDSPQLQLFELQSTAQSRIDNFIDKQQPWVAFVPRFVVVTQKRVEYALTQLSIRPSRSPLRSSLSGIIPSSPSTSRRTRGFAMRSLSLLQSVFATRLDDALSRLGDHSLMDIRLPVTPPI